MSRSLKSLIMILLILAVGGAVIITANYAKGNSGDSKNMNGADGSNISDVMPNNSNSNNMEQPPEKPDENIVVDNISTLKMNLKNNSSYKGSINNDKSVKNITLKLDKASKITLTGDSYVTSLEDDDTSYSNINFNGYKLFVSKKAIN